MENQAVELLIEVYKSIPVDVLNGWGIDRYNRFRVQVWKCIESMSTLDGVFNLLFKHWPMKVSLYSKLEKTENKEEIYQYIKENLPILIAQMQAKIKKEKEIKNDVAEDV